MFLALRDLAHAKGRFALIGAVMALITLLVIMLTGLAAGLGKESISAITTLKDRGVSQVAFTQPAAGQQVGYDSSHIDDETVQKLAQAKGVDKAEALTIAQGRASVSGAPNAVSVFVVPDGSFAAPKGVAAGSVVVGAGLTKNTKLSAGDSIRFGTKDVRVASLSDNASYQHVPVVWMTKSDARAAHVLGNGPSANAPTVALLKTGSGFDADDVSSTLHVTTESPADSVSTIESYKAENGSLTLMRVMLMLVSALVIGAFFTVWTIQRTPDLAVLKAIGARTGYLMRDALGQAAIVLLVGGGIGTAVAVVAGLFAKGTVPFVLNVATTVVPLLLLVALGLLGALVSVRRIASVDPNSALGDAR